MVLASLSRHGFRLVVLLPTHGGNFKPLAEAVDELKPVENVEVIAFTDLEALTNNF
jgi:creatinine amidohydrolase